MATLNGSIDNQFIKEYKDLDPKIQQLITAANEVRKNAYVPYSNFAVGAAILTSNGDIFTGCNIENSSFPASICAERSAVSNAISQGHRNFIACAIVAHKENSFVFPCGICRQVLAEFTNQRNDMEIYLSKPSSTPLRVLCTTIKQIIPFIFRLREDTTSELNQSLHMND